MLRQGLIGFSAILGASVLSYVYHFILVRLLDTGTYGSLSIIIGLFTIFIIPTQSIQRILARDVAKLYHGGGEDEARHLLRSSAKTVSVIGVVVGVIFLASAYAVSAIYDEPRLIAPLIALAFLAPFWYVLHVFKGYIQGREKMMVLGTTIVIEQAVKVVVGTALVLLGFSLFGAGAAIGSGVLVALPFMLIFCLKDFTGSVKKYKTSFTASFTKIFMADVLLMVFIFLDLFFVKYYLGSTQAGYYNVAALTSKVLMYSMFGIMLAFLPRASKLSIRDDWGKIRVLMVKSAAILLPLFLFLIVFTEPIVTISYTRDYLPAVPALRILLAGMFIYALFNIPLNLLWSQKEEDYPLALAAAIIVVDAILLYFLIPRYGLTGAALSTTLAATLLLAASYAKVAGMRKFNAPVK
ncbi:MAG: oligosaccharide flippase family protein [Candidatus Altiarchaeota archaeon]